MKTKLSILFVIRRRKALVIFSLNAVSLWQIWMKVFKWWNIKGVMHSDPITNILQWQELCFGRKKIVLWDAVFGCVVWTIWLEWNRVKLQGRVPEWLWIWEVIKYRIGCWAKDLPKDFKWSSTFISSNIDVVVY